MVSRGAVHDLVELRDAIAEHGGKARGLARLIAAGLPVPDGFVISAKAFERFAHGDEVTLELPELPPIVVVRSSAAVEDGAAGSAAGLFLSERVAAEDVWTAIRAVWSSALSPHVVAYAKTHEVALGVIVQRFVEGERITVYTRALDGGEDVLVQRGDAIARLPRSSADPVVVLALRAEAAIGAPADVELVQGEQLWIVQARPIVVRAREVVTAPPPIVLAALQDGRTWTWDVTHNPDPLSPAQAALVELVEREKLGGYELRMCAGYLYSTPRDVKRAFANELAGALISTCRELEAQCEQLLVSASDLDDALAKYIAFYRIWADELSPRIGELRTRRAQNFYANTRTREQDRPVAGSSARPANEPPFRVFAFSRKNSGHEARRPSSVEATLALAAGGAIRLEEVVRRIGALAPTWDVAVPTFGEQPELLRRAIAASKPGDVDTSERTSENIDLDSITADLAERDDLLFARAQLIVRNALLARADANRIDRDDIFWIPFDESDPVAAKRSASANRAAHERARRWQMPITVPTQPSTTNPTLRGVGFGPRVAGRVVRYASLSSAMFATTGDVVVVRAVTPALAVFVGKCAALVSETGGLLDHGAALARELGITCVVGCTNAWTQLTDGELVTVDGDAGTITTT